MCSYFVCIVVRDNATHAGAHIRYAAPLARARPGTQTTTSSCCNNSEQKIYFSVFVHVHTQSRIHKQGIQKMRRGACVNCHIQHTALDHMLNGNVSSHFSGTKFRYLGSCFRVFFCRYGFRARKRERKSNGTNRGKKSKQKSRFQRGDDTVAR